MSLIISSYDKYLKNNRIDSNNDDMHDRFYKKILNNNPKIMYEKEPELLKYKIDKITYTKPNYKKYDMHINLYSKFKYENIKLNENENENYNASKKYDGVVSGLVENKLPSSYYQYKLQNIDSSKMLLNNLETNADIPNQLNLLRLNEKTGYTIPEIKRDNIDRQNALNSVLDNYLNKKNNYTSKTSDETKEKDIKYKDKKIIRINNTPYNTTPSSLNKKIIINPAIIPTMSATSTSEVEDENQVNKLITNVERKRHKLNESVAEFIERINKKKIITPKTTINKKKIINPIVNPVKTITEPLIKSEEIEENKTIIKLMKKPRQTRTESRKQRSNESDYDYEQRIVTLDKGIETRKIKKEERLVLSKMREADFNARLAALKTDSGKSSESTSTQIADTKTPN